MHPKLRSFVASLALILVSAWALPSAAQVIKGSISGTIFDPQDRVVVGAVVTAKNTETGGVFTTTSDSSGLFRLSLLPVGTYTVEVTAQGFKTTAQKGIAVTAGGDVGMGKIRLSLGQASQTVEVSATEAQLETLNQPTEAQVTHVFSGIALNNFVGIQENQGLDRLALFVPGIVSTRDDGFSNTNGAGFYSQGIRGRNNDQEIDGQNNNDNSVGGPGLFLSDVNFVDQYVIITNNFGPEYGRNAGSVVNIITKSGSNSWHGAVYGSENNSYLNALSNQQRFNGLNKPPRTNEEFTGAVIGGPIVKNKVFLFGGFDNDITSGSSLFSNSSITPTPAGLAQLAACPAGIVNPAAFAIVKNFGPYAFSAGNPTPDPSTIQVININTVANPCNVQFAGVSRVLQTPVNQYNWVLRNDVQLNKDTISSRYIYNYSNFTNNDDNGAGGWVFDVPALSQAMLVSWAHTFSGRMANELRLGFGRLNVDFGGNGIGNAFEPTAPNLRSALTNISFTNSNLGIGPNPALPQSRIVNTWQVQDNWNYVRGKHQFKAGVNWSYQRSPNTFLPDINGAYVFPSFASFLTSNSPTRVSIANGNPNLDFREYDTFLYAGDDWKIGQNLTLNLGLTWTYYGSPANLFNDITTKQETSSTPFWKPSLPLSVRTDPKIPSIKNSFGPSVGFAYSPQWGGFLTGHGKTVFRGGYRMLYDPPFYNIFLNESTSAPMVLSQTISSPGPVPAVPTGTNVQAALASSLVLGVFDPRTFSQVNVSPNFGPDKVHSWSFGFEREISKNAALEVRYVGNHGYNLYQTVNTNPFIADLKADFPTLVPAGLVPCPAASAFNPIAIGRINCNQGLLESRNNGGFSNYNGLQVEFRANNLFKQLTIHSGYTFSKTLDNVSEIFSTFGAGNTLSLSQNPSEPGRPEYSFSGLNVPHVFSTIFIEQLPFFKNQHGYLGHLLGGWDISGTYILASGQGYTPLQLFEDAIGTANGDYYDSTFVNAHVGVDIARPFVGSASAPASSVGIFGGDACSFFGVCTYANSTPIPATQLISYNGISNCAVFDPSLACNVVNTTKNAVRFIINAGTAQSIFGTPFGSAGRNTVRDAMQNIGTFAVYKRIKLTERTSFEMHVTLDNAFNHFNFSSVVPFIEEAGATPLFGQGYGIPSVTNASGRRVTIGGKFIF